MPRICYNSSMPAEAKPSKLCAACGRTMVWRPRWARNWETVKYCSDACRKRRVSSEDTQIEQTILKLLAARQHGATICPSEASRALWGQAGLLPARMQQVRYGANRLVAQHLIDITQKGQVVDASRAKGPIRLRLKPL